MVDTEPVLIDQHREAVVAAGSRAALQVCNTSYPELLQYNTFVHGSEGFFFHLFTEAYENTLLNCLNN